MEERLERYLNILVEQVKARPYEYWAATLSESSYIAYEEVFEGRETQVEIYAAEVTPEYVLLLVSASISPWGWDGRLGKDVMIRKED